ncbi:MAG: hypothetical protein ACRER5_05090, partial [Pseudomonas sp.]
LVGDQCATRSPRRRGHPGRPINGDLGRAGGLYLDLRQRAWPRYRGHRHYRCASVDLDLVHAVIAQVDAQLDRLDIAA